MEDCRARQPPGSNWPWSPLERACSSGDERSGTRYGAALTGRVRRRARSSHRARWRVSNCALADDRARPTAPLPAGLGSMNRSRNRAASWRLTSRSTARTPPRPGKCFDKLRAKAAPKLPIGCPSTSVSSAWPASSISGIPNRPHVAPSSTTGSGRPYVLAVRTAEASTRSRHRLRRCGCFRRGPTSAPSPAGAQPRGRRRTRYRPRAGT